MEQQYKYQLAISITTANRYGFIREMLRKMAKTLYENHVGLYLFDGSNRDSLKDTIGRYQDAGYDNIHYFYYDPKTYPGDERLQRSCDARNKVEAEYVWFCSDKLFPSQEGVQEVVKKLDRQYDVIVYNSLLPEGEETKEYYDQAEFFRECTAKLQMLSVVILRQTILKKYTEKRMKYCITHKKYTDMEIILREILHLEDFSALRICLGHGERPMLLALRRRVDSGHVREARTLGCFVGMVYDTISKLPGYDKDDKYAVMKSISCNTWFSIEGFALLRASKGYCFKQCLKYFDKFRFVSNVPLVLIIGISILPPDAARILYEIICEYKCSRGMRCFGKSCKRSF